MRILKYAKYIAVIPALFLMLYSGSSMLPPAFAETAGESTETAVPSEGETSETRSETAGESAISTEKAAGESQNAQKSSDSAVKISDSVTMIYDSASSEQTANAYQPVKWHKTELEAYQNLQWIHYETTEPEEEDILPDPQILAEGGNDTVILTVPTASAVQTTDENTFAFTSYGWGHGVGMSQNGANFYAKYAGWNYQDILFHYYPGTVLKNTGTAETELVTVQGVSGNVLQQVAEIVNIEVGPNFHPECIKAQAVAVYTYIKYYNDDAHDLKGKPDPPQSLIDLCASVLGEALYYDDKYCLTMFCASCGGVTANCYDVFSADLPYLRSVSSEYDAAYDPHWGDVTYYTVDEVKSRIEKEYKIKLSDHPENWIKLVVGNGGYVAQVILDDQVTVRGNAFRSAMGLKSPKFTYICSIPGVASSEDDAIVEETIEFEDEETEEDPDHPESPEDSDDSGESEEEN